MDSLRSAARAESLEEEVIGYSEDGRPIQVVFSGLQDAPLRIVVMAGQHGDERYASRAVRALAKSGRSWEGARLAFVPCVNPDGYERRQRGNSRGSDLNRDHLHLEAAETRALHEFIRQWHPDVILDVHNYPSARRFLLEQGLIRCSDVCLDVPTHPAARQRHPELDVESIRASAAAALAYLESSCDRYALTRKTGVLRHSTLDIVDARNFLALRYGAFTVLVEGRAPRREDDLAKRQQLQASLRASIRAVIWWALANQGVLRLPKSELLRIPVRFHYGRNGDSGLLRLRSLITGMIEQHSYESYRRELKITRSVSPPEAYAIPETSTFALSLLSRHGCVPQPAGEAEWSVARARVLSLRPARLLHHAPGRIRSEIRRERTRLPGYMIVHSTPADAPFLAVLLELKSKYALHRFPDSELTPRAGEDYPILRVAR